MARIFISHSGKNPEGIALHNWLIQEGWGDLFFDRDPERGIAAGERWETVLYQEVNRCDAVLFLISQAWLDTTWCLKELHLAQRLGKRLFGVLIEAIPDDNLPKELTATWQWVDLAAGNDHDVFYPVLPGGEEKPVIFSKSGLDRLKNGLIKAGMDPSFFTWPPEGEPNRSPYRGMQPMEAKDAGIFFGREAPLMDLLTELRLLRQTVAPGFLVILGASGSGKSSFLRAGIVPRLKRDDNFLPLPIIRPEKRVLTGDNGLLPCLRQALSLKISSKELHNAIATGLKCLVTPVAPDSRCCRSPWDER